MAFSAKKSIALLGAAAMLVSVAACGSDTANSGDSAAKSDGGKTELTLWGWDGTLPEVIEGFEKKYPDITVKLSNVGTSAETQTSLNNALAAGKGAPDVAQMEYHSITQFALSDGLEDLTDLAGDYQDFYQEGTWKGVQVGGKTYGMPLDSGPNALFYNKEVFDKAGVTEAPKTWDEFYEAAKKIHALGDDYYITSDAGDNSQSTTFMSLVAQAGGEPFTVDGENVGINLTGDEGTKKTVDYWQKMIDEGLINTKVTSWSDEWNRGLGDGTLASLVIGAWMPTNLLNGAPGASGKFRVATVPQWSDGENVNSENGGSALVMPKGTKNKDAAWKFMDYVSHDAEGIKLRVNDGAFPADNETLKEDYFLKGTEKLTTYFGGQAYNEVLAEAASQKIGDFQFLPFWAQAQNTFGDFAGKAYRGEEKLTKSMEDYQKSLVDYGKNQGFTIKEG